MSLSDTIILAKSETILSTNLGDEYVMMDIDSGDYFSLSGVSLRIWELLETPSSAGDLIATLTSEYDIDKDTCSAEVISFLAELLEAKILIPA